MAVSAYVFMQAKVTDPRPVVAELAKIPGVKSVHALAGPTDCVAFVEADDLNALFNLVIEKIRATAGVAGTDTRLVVS